MTAGHLDVISRAAQLDRRGHRCCGWLREEKSRSSPLEEEWLFGEGGHARFAQRARRALRRAVRRLRLPPHGRPGQW
ncbi:MAG: hypothetical protein ACLTDR_04960 [Adlercreutzia equolifaciens]